MIFWFESALLSTQIVAAEAASARSPGTLKMAALLESIVKKANPDAIPFLSRERAKLLASRVASVTDPGQLLEMRYRLATELLNSGESEEALAEHERVEKLYLKYQRLSDSKQRATLSLYKAICHLRIGEQENCLSNHNSDSCILPIREGGIHKFQRGSREAIKLLRRHLGRFSTDLRAKWLLNIAAMTVGDYPDKVPRQWLIDPKVFASDYELPRFPNVAGGLGLDLEGLAGAVVAEDFDGDGDLDLLMSRWGLRDQLRYFRNEGDGSYKEQTEAAGLLGLVGGLNMTHADYNNDGLPDVLVLRGAWLGAQGRFPNSLLRNDGQGRFSDVTEEAGVLSFCPTQTAAWFDYNNDGWIDLFIGNESTSNDVHPCELYRNNGNGTFTECAAAAGVAKVGFVKGVTSGDFNNDGRPDLYLSLLHDANVLFRNDGPKGGDATPGSDWVFTDVAAAAGVTEPMRSFPTWFWDYDNDGWLDIFVCGYQLKNVADVAADYLGLPHTADRARLFRNNRDGTFNDVTKSANLFKMMLTMGSNFGDFDNDGFLDFYCGTGDPDLSTLVPNRAFRNADGKLFQEVTTAAGLGHLQKGHGVCFADLDEDGDQDIFIVVGGANSGDTYRNALFENPGHGNQWIKLKLEGVQSNRAAIGARIRITLETPNGSRSIHRTVNTGGSFGSHPFRREIGLGRGSRIQQVAVTWPVTGKTQTFADLQANQAYLIREGDPKAVLLALKKVTLARNAKHHHQ